MPNFFSKNYTLLIRLWRYWLLQDSWPPLDKWLKSQSHLTRQSSTVCFAMQSALRYVQLADALEETYRRGSSDIDWVAWDISWQISAIRHVSPLAFWYWIGLRTASSPDAVPPPPALRDAAARLRHYQQLLAARPQGLAELWHGIRPQWLPLLRQRQRASGWTESQLATFIDQQSFAPPLWLRVQQNQTTPDVFRRWLPRVLMFVSIKPGLALAVEHRYRAPAFIAREGWKFKIMQVNRSRRQWRLNRVRKCGMPVQAQGENPWPLRTG